MDYRMVGATGMEVSVLGFGAMMLGKLGRLDHDESIELLHAAFDAGINLVDTADEYGAGESEIIVGKALAQGHRDDVILATKSHYSVEHGSGHPHPPPNTRGNSRRHIVRACEASLRRLQTDHIDLYHIHYPDHRTSLEETLGALTDLVRAGKVRAFGASNFPADHIVEAQWVSERRALYRAQVEQFPYSLFVRWAERDLMPVLQRHSIGGLAYSPLNGGWLSGTYRAGMQPRREFQAARTAGRFDISLPHVQQKARLVEPLTDIANALGTSLLRLAVRWTLEHPAVDATIIGVRTLDQLKDTLGAESLVLPPEVLDRLDELVPPGTNVHSEESRWKTPYLTARNRRRSSHISGGGA